MRQITEVAVVGASRLTPEEIVARVREALTILDAPSVFLNPDCGFGTWVGQAAVDPDVVFAKLKAMAEGAALASRQFWK